MYLRLNSGGRWLVGGLIQFVAWTILAALAIVFLIKVGSWASGLWSSSSVSPSPQPPNPAPVQYAAVQNRPPQVTFAPTQMREDRTVSPRRIEPARNLFQSTTTTRTEARKPAPVVVKPAPQLKSAPVRNQKSPAVKTSSLRPSTIRNPAMATVTIPTPIRTASRSLSVAPYRQTSAKPYVVPYARPVIVPSIYSVSPQRTVMPSYVIAAQPPVFVAAPTIRYVLYAPWPTTTAPATSVRVGVSTKPTPKKPSLMTLVSYDKLATRLLTPKPSETAWQLHGVEVGALVKKSPTTAPASDSDREFRYER